MILLGSLRKDVDVFYSVPETRKGSLHARPVDCNVILHDLGHAKLVARERRDGVFGEASSFVMHEWRKA